MCGYLQELCKHTKGKKSPYTCNSVIIIITIILISYSICIDQIS